MPPVAAGTTKYPIIPRYVLKLDRPRKKLNKRAGGVIDHDVYIWIQTRGRLPKGRPEKERYFTTVTCYIPKISAFRRKPVIERRSIQKESIARALKPGYTIISRNIPFWYKDKDYETFYRLLRLL
jgi:hypothetical protein